MPKAKRETKVLVLSNICIERNGVNKRIPMGETASLYDEELERYVDIGAVERPKFRVADLQPEPKLEGGEA